MATRKNGNGNGNGNGHKRELEKWTQEITELELFAENEGKLYPAKKRVIAAMKTKIEQGQYSAELAVKGWRHWVDEAVAEYGRQFKMTNLAGSFPTVVRNEVARRIAEAEAEAIRNGDYGALKAARYEHSAATWEPKSGDPDFEAKQAKLRELERKFTARAEKVPTNKVLFDDPVIARIMKQRDRLIESKTINKASGSPKSGAKYHTRYEGPTDTTGSRIIVTNLTTKKRKTVSYDYAARDAHEAALREVIGDTEGLTKVDDGSNGYYWKGPLSRGESVVAQHSKEERHERARQSKLGKMPRINLGRIHLNRQGYTATGRYFGVGKPLFRAFNTANNQEVEFRASDRPQAMGIVKMMFTEPRHESVTERFTPGQVKEFVSND